MKNNFKQKLASYDTGFGLSIAPIIVDECGNEQETVSTIEVVTTRLFKVELPDQNLPSDEWDRQWQLQKKIVQDMIDAYNEKLEG